MAFPDDNLDIEVKIDTTGDGIHNLDITSRVLSRDGNTGISIRRGGSPEGAYSDPGTCDFQINNRNGDFSPRNPNSPYYGQIGRNTSVQVAVKGGDTYLHVMNTSAQGASTPDSASLSITGDIDIRFDGTLENWFAAGGFDGTAELCGKGDFTAGGRAWILMVRNDVLRFEWSADGTNVLVAESTVKPLIPLSRRMAVRVTLDAAVTVDAVPSNMVTFYTSDSIDGTWTQLGEPVVQSGTTSINDDSFALNVGNGWPSLGFDSAVGKVHAFELYNGIAGTLVASPDFRIQADGAVSFNDAQGNTWTRQAFPNSNITDLDVRFIGEILAWPNRWDTSGNDVWVPVRAKGILRRLDAGRTTLDSTLRRRIPTLSPIAYWPMEDGSESDRFYSPIAGVNPLVQTGMDLAVDNTLGGSEPLPKIREDAYFAGGFPPGADTGSFTMDFVYYFPSPIPGSNVMLLAVETSGTVKRFEAHLRSGVLHMKGFDVTNTDLLNQDVAISNDVLFNRWSHIRLQAVESGSTVDYTIIVFQESGTGLSITKNVASANAGRPYAVHARPPGYVAAADGVSIGHIAVFNDTTSANTAYGSAMDGFDGERAGVRFDRLSEEEGVDAVIHGWTSETEQLGPQGPSTFLNLLRDSAEADSGVLTEARERYAVKLIGLASLTNQEPTVTLTYPDHIQPGLEPEPDDLGVENDVSVTRQSGSTGRVEVTEGALSVNDPPDGVGRYEVSYTLDIFSDDRVDDHAGWRAHVGTVDEERYTAVPVWVSASPSLFGTLSLLDVGTILRLDNQQTTTTQATGNKLPPGDIDLLIKGYEEFLNQRRWEFSFNGTPYKPYLVAQADHATLGVTDTAGSTLNTGVNTTATSLSVATATLPLWSTDGADAPFTITMGGEEITVTAVSGASSPQTFTVTRSVNGVVKSHSADADIRLKQPAITALN